MPISFICASFRSSTHLQLTSQLRQGKDVIGFECRVVLVHGHHLQEVPQVLTILILLFIFLTLTAVRHFHLFQLLFDPHFIVLGYLRPITCLDISVLPNLLFCNLVPLLLISFFSATGSLLGPYYSLFHADRYLFFNVSSYFSFNSLIFSNSRSCIRRSLPFSEYLPLTFCSPAG